MKNWVSILVVFGCSLSCFSAENQPDYSATIGAISDYSGENKDGVAVVGLRFDTSQFGGDFRGAIRIWIELTDKNKKVYFGKVKHPAPVFKINKMGRSPNGMITWAFEVLASDMKRPKVTGFAVEYGYKDGDEFKVLDAKFDDVDSAQELVDRNKDSLSVKVIAVKKKVEYDYRD